MNKQEPPTWLDVNEAAALVEKSVSTIRRLVSTLEAEEPEHIRREPLKDKGGDKILISRAYLVARYEIQEPAHGAGTDPAGEEPQERPAGNVVEILERQLEAKDRQISALQREAESKNRQLEQEQQNAAEFAESLRQFAAINTALNNKLLALTEKAGEYPERPAAAGNDDRVTNSPWYFVALAVALSLIAGLVLYLLLF